MPTSIITNSNAYTSDDDDDSLYNEQPITAMNSSSHQFREIVLDSSEDVDTLLDAEEETDNKSNKNDDEDEDEDDEDVDNTSGIHTSTANDNPPSSSSFIEQTVEILDDEEPQQHQRHRHRYRRHQSTTSNSPTDPNSPSPPPYPIRRTSTTTKRNGSNNLEDDVDLDNLEYVENIDNNNSNNNSNDIHLSSNSQETGYDPPSDGINVDTIPMVEVNLTPRSNEEDNAHLDNNDVRFDSDEHVDVESLSTSDDEKNEATESPLPPMRQRAASIPLTHIHNNDNNDKASSSSNRDNVTNVIDPAHVSSAELLPPSSISTPHSQRNSVKRPSQAPSSSLLSRASKTFYKTFIGRKTSSSSTKHNKQEKKNKLQQTDSNDGESNLTINENDDRYERLCRLLDAQLSALDGAKTGFVQLSLLRPLAEQTLNAVSNDARSLLGEFGELEARAEKRKQEVEKITEKGEEEIVRKEQLLIEAKVALAEACGEVERLRGELASTKRKLADPMVKERRLRKQRDLVRRDTEICRDTRTAVEDNLTQRRRSLSKEKIELGRMEKEFRDIEGDWA